MKFLWRCNLFYPPENYKRNRSHSQTYLFLYACSSPHSPQLSTAVREGLAAHPSRTESSSLKVNDNLSQSHSGLHLPSGPHHPSSIVVQPLRIQRRDRVDCFYSKGGEES